jgi:hypothetical protein
MTSKHSQPRAGALPFIVRYAELSAEVPTHTFRYDSERQLSQVLVDGRWIDSPEAFLEPPGTHHTKVGGETTDDT